MAMDGAVAPMLDDMGIRSLWVDRPEDVVPVARAAFTQTFSAGEPTTVLLTSGSSAQGDLSVA
jgi:hypothetical protein